MGTVAPAEYRRRVLVLSPQPFYQNRGTPIAVKVLVEELALLGHEVHLLVFHEGEEVCIDSVRLHRTPRLSWVRDIPPSLSWKKLVCDLLMVATMLRLHRRFRFELVHAVEEAAFIAQFAGWFTGVPYVYDMDSSLPIQVVDKIGFAGPLRPLLELFEKSAVRGSAGVLAVCRALEEIALGYGPKGPVTRLEDISLLDEGCPGEELLRQALAIDGPIMLYVGNLEGYQGIDLALRGFALARRRGAQGNLVIIGGSKQGGVAYRDMAKELGVADHTFLVGPRPVALLGHYLAQADILLSPRTQGNNTPMKLYSYLDSGKPVIATDLPTHTQVLNGDIARLVAPEAEAMAAAMEELLGDPVARHRLGANGRRYAQANHSRESFRRKLADFYRRLPAD